ncbi:MAG: GNAT family N-acetyltransferase [Vulcanimicrobiaceae bacterium]
MGSLEALTAQSRDETLAYLACRPYDNVFVAWLIETGQASRGDVLVWRDAARAVTGVCYLGLQIVPTSDDPEAIAAFAERARRVRDTRMIVGPRRDVERFWSHARSWMPGPSATRTSQPVYVLASATALEPVAVARGDVARATRAELDEIVPESAAMIAGEIGGDPSRASHDFRNRTQRIVDAGWWWRYRVDGRLAFMCNVGSATAQTAQLQGVWSPAAMRGAGHATIGLGAICARLLQTVPTLSLYVNDFNHRAIALYERVGFVRAGEFQTVLFS